jgi:hypothetical protein
MDEVAGAYAAYEADKRCRAPQRKRQAEAPFDDVARPGRGAAQAGKIARRGIGIACPPGDLGDPGARQPRGDFPGHELDAAPVAREIVRNQGES